MVEFYSFLFICLGIFGFITGFRDAKVGDEPEQNRGSFTPIYIRFDGDSHD